jgi:hypothetical protein
MALEVPLVGFAQSPRKLKQNQHTNLKLRKTKPKTLKLKRLNEVINELGYAQNLETP